MKIINLPLDTKQTLSLKAGDEVLLNGIIYTARDQAHKRLVKSLVKGGGAGRKLPFDIKHAVIYYCGPAKTPKGKIIGSCGPTTASRMDEFTPILLKAGLKGMIGKGRRLEAVVKAIKKYRGVYFITYAGCAALLSKYVVEARPLAYKDLGPEAIYELKVENFPAIVAIDANGKNIYK